MDNNVPSCKDCKWFQAKTSNIAVFSECSRPGVQTVEGIKPTTHIERSRAPYGIIDRCGPEGKYFDPTLWKRVKDWFKGTIIYKELQLLQ